MFTILQVNKSNAVEYMPFLNLYRVYGASHLSKQTQGSLHHQPALGSSQTVWSPGAKHSHVDQSIHREPRTDQSTHQEHYVANLIILTHYPL